jgi:hypothetical protein
MRIRNTVIFVSLCIPEHPRIAVLLPVPATAFRTFIVRAGACDPAVLQLVFGTRRLPFSYKQYNLLAGDVSLV